MAGRGYVKDVKPIYDEHIKMLVNGRWQTMTEPINYDRPTSGIGLAASFAGAWRLKNEDLEAGLKLFIGRKMCLARSTMKTSLSTGFTTNL